MRALPSRATLDEILPSFDSEIKFGDFSTSIPPISLRYHQIIELLHGNLQYLSFISLWGFFCKRWLVVSFMTSYAYVRVLTWFPSWYVTQRKPRLKVEYNISLNTICITMVFFQRWFNHCSRDLNDIRIKRSSKENNKTAESMLEASLLKCNLRIDCDTEHIAVWRKMV